VKCKKSNRKHTNCSKKLRTKYGGNLAGEMAREIVRVKGFKREKCGGGTTLRGEAVLGDKHAP